MTRFGNTTRHRSRGLGARLVLVAALLAPGLAMLGADVVAASTAGATPLTVDGGRTIASASSTTCGITTSGGVRCWGWNDGYELGTGDAENSATPKDVPGLTGVVAVTGSWTHMCALTDAGRAWCWGFPDPGDGTEAAASPTTPTGLASGVVAIDAGGKNTCAVKDDGSVWCWGPDLPSGNGANTRSHVPLKVQSLTDITTISVDGDLACAGSSTGAWCWGLGSALERGNPSADSSLTPGPVHGLGGVKALGTGRAGGCAVTLADALWCWGSSSTNGIGTDAPTATPVPGFAAHVRSLAMQDITACAIKADGSLWCWGQPDDMGFGSATLQDAATPVRVTTLGAAVVSVDVVANHACAITVDGAGRCWGKPRSGWWGVLGTQGWDGAYRTPHVVPGFESGVVDVSTGGTFTCVLDTDGAVRCGGSMPPTVPVRTTTYAMVTGLGVSTAVRAGLDFACALSTAGGVSCWGANGSGQLGNGTNTASATPVPVTGLSSDVVALDAGTQTACAILTGGAVRCWGANSSGQLGNGTTTSSTTPVAVTGLTSGVTAVSTGGHSCATTPSGLECWGSNQRGQVGDTSRTARKTPVAVSSGLAGTASVGGSHTCSTDTHELWCWGDNSSSQLGNGTTTDSSVPVKIPSSLLAAGYVGTVGSSSDSCALGADGTVRCWGSNQWGMSGTGRPEYWVPVASPAVVIASGATKLSADPAGTQVCAVVDGALACWGQSINGEHGFEPWLPQPVSGGNQFEHAAASDIDDIAPTVEATITPGPDAQGVRAAPVTVHFSCTDLNSGVESCPAEELVTAPGTTTVSGAATDVAGNATTASVTVVVDAPSPCSCVSVTANINAVPRGQAITFTATTTLGTTGTAEFLDGVTPLGTAMVRAGTAKLTTTKLARGTHAITARWKQSSSADPVASDPWFQLVDRAVTTTAVTTSVEPSVYGQSVTVQASVKAIGSGAGVATGRIDLYDGPVLLAQGSLARGSFRFKTKPTVGPHTLTADYLGDADRSPSIAAPSTLVVNPAATKIALSTPSPSIPAGKPRGVTAAVSTVSPGGGTPMGTVTLYRDGDVFAVGSLASGKVLFTFVSTFPTPGTYVLTARYGGDETHAGSETTSELVQTIT